MSSNENTMANIKESLTNALAIEKQRLCLAIGERLVDDDARTTSELGSLGHLPGLPGTLYVNCYKNGKPCPDLTGKYSVGNGRNSLSHYFWIPAIYRDGDIELRYLLSLCREDLDVSTGNLHADFTRLQMTRLIHEGPEIGGSANVVAASIKNGWLLEYESDLSFPVASRGTHGYGVETDTRPWGHGGFEDKIPVLDMADPAYDPGAVAGFFIELIVRDVRDELEHYETYSKGACANGGQNID